MSDIPENAADITATSDTTRTAELEKRELDLQQKEYELLEKGDELRTLKNKLEERERKQRYWLRNIAVGNGIIVIIAMFGIMAHLTHSTFWGPFYFAGRAFAVAMIVAPIASITAITVALFVGAFRKFDDKDLETMGNGAAGAYNTFRGH